MENDGYSDDPTIPDEAELWRRIPPWHFVKDENLGQIRPSKAAFDNHPNGSPMSVVLADVVVETGRGPDAVLAGHKGVAAVETAIDVFVGYLMFDAWIANQDRHHENWGLVETLGSTHLAPSYDHASSLGSGETDPDREDRLTTRDKRRSMERYVERASSAFYASPSSKKPLSTLEAFREAGRPRPKATDAWLERLRQVSSQDIAFIFDQVPQDRITPVASRFAQKMLELNRQRLLALQGVWP